MTYKLRNSAWDSFVECFSIKFIQCLPYHVCCRGSFLCCKAGCSYLPFVLSFFKLNFIYFLNIYLCIYLFIFGCIGSSLLRAGATLRCGVQASYCSGFSCGARALGSRASVVVACGLNSCGSQASECRLSSCGSQAQLLRGMWDLPGPGLEPMSPALAGGFLTTAPPGKSPLCPL